MASVIPWERGHLARSEREGVAGETPALPRFSPFFRFAVIMAPIANTPYIFPNLADNWQLRGPRPGSPAGALDWPPRAGQRAEICLISSLNVLKRSMPRH